MEKIIHNITTSKCLKIPTRHTAYKTKRAVLPFTILWRRAAAKKKSNSSIMVTLFGLPDVKIAVDFMLLHRTGRLFLLMAHSVGCRSPPSFLNS